MTLDHQLQQTFRHVARGVAAPEVDLDAVRSQARRDRRRKVSVAVVAVVVAVLVAGTALVTDRTVRPPTPVDPVKPGLIGRATNGWVAIDTFQGGGDIYLVRSGEEARLLEVAGSDDANDACPAWSPDGARLMFGRLTGSEDTGYSDPQLVIVSVDKTGAVGSPTKIPLDGFEVLRGFDAHPCAIWAPDGRWVAFAGTGEVWVVNTQTSAIRRLPDLRPSDLEWRPGSDELAIAGDMGSNRSAPTEATPVTVYSVSTGELRQLGSVEAAHITWSPDGTTMAYIGGEADPQELWLVNGRGANNRLVVGDLGEANHGIGPAWSPSGDRIAYQRLATASGESHEVVLVNVADATETVIEPPVTDGLVWYPSTVSWSPDGRELLYAGWSSDDEGAASNGGVVAVPADQPSDTSILIDAVDPVPNNYSHRWSATQMWGRQPGRR